MSASNPGPGRPAGISEATLEKQRRVREMDRLGIPRATIAAVEKCTPGYIGMLINGGAREDGSPEPAANIAPPQPRRLSRRVAQYRAWEIVQQRPTPTLGLDVNAFWIRLIVEIHETGDGVHMGIGGPTSRFATRGDLEIMFARPDTLEIDEWLKRLFKRGRLVDVDGVDIAIPFGMKLTPAENIRKKRTTPPPRDGQLPLLHAVPGDLSEPTETPFRTQIKSELNLRGDEFNSHSPASEIPLNANLIPNLIPPFAGGRAATATAYAKDINTLAAAVATEPRAGDATETRIKFASGASENPPLEGASTTEIILQRSLGGVAAGVAAGTTEIILQRSSAAELTAELASLAGLGRPPNAEDLGWVEAWVDQGFSAETMRGVIEIKRTQMHGKRVTGLRYFDGPMQDSRRSRVRAPPEAPQSPTSTGPPAARPPAALSPADQAIQDRLAPFQSAWIRDRGINPWPPDLSYFDATCDVSPLAYRWLVQAENWASRARDRDLKPPDFATARTARSLFERDLVDAEEALLEAMTAPDPPEAAD